MPTFKEDPVTLATLANGAAMELFDNEMSKVVENVLDPNTEPDTVREVCLKVKIKPDSSRKNAAVYVQVSSKTGAFKGAGTMFYFGKHQGKYFAVESNPDQGMLFDKPATLININKDTGEINNG
jgi:hypothetical protein